MRIETLKKTIGILLSICLLSGLTLALSYAGGGLLIPLIIYGCTAIILGLIWFIFWLFDIHN